MSDRLAFIDDVFERRLKSVPHYPISSLKQLVGENPDVGSYNEIARQIRAKKYPQLWGRESFGELCCGDIHYLLELANKMVTATGGPSNLGTTEPAVSPEVQHKSVREAAGNFLRTLRGLDDGDHLVDIVEIFGAVASSYLRYRNHKSKDGEPPHQASRIEPYENPNLTGKAKHYYDELLRYSVFLEDVRGKSRRGKVVPRLYLRRFLVPFFNLTFNKRDSIELSAQDLSLLLTQPKEFEKKKRLKSDSNNGAELSDNGPLFETLDSDEHDEGD